MAGTHERPVHHCKIVAIRIKTGANAIDVAKRGKEPERLGKKASAVGEIEQSVCAGSDEAIAYRRRDDCTLEIAAGSRGTLPLSGKVRVADQVRSDLAALRYAHDYLQP